MKRLLFLMLSTLCAGSFAQLPDYVPTEGLVGWWPMDGNGTDASGNDLHLLENEVTSVADRLNQQGKALQFNGESSYLLRSTSLDLLEDSDTFSIQFWAKAGPTSTVEPQCIFYEGFPGEFHFANADPGTDFTSFHWAAKADGNVWYGPGHEIDTDWFHVVGVQNAGLLTLYMDGQNIGSDFSAACCVNAPNDQMVIGARRVTSSIEHPFDGTIDDFGIWNRALTEEEVLALYISEQPVSGCTNPAACNYEPTATEDDGSCLDSISILNVGDTVVITEPLILESSGTQCSWSTGAETCSITVTESGWYSVTQLVSTSEGLRIDPGQQVSLGGEDDFNFGTGDFSIAIWFRSLDSITDYSSQLDPNGQFEILGKRPTSLTNNNNFYYDIQAGISQHTSYGTNYQAGPGTKFHWNSEPHPGSFNAYTDQVVCDGSWHHLTAVKEGTTLKMAIDGSFVHSAQDRTPSSGQIADNNGQLFLGVSDSVYAPMSYFIGQVQIFNAALTETDLESVMAEAIDSSVTSLLGAWEFRGEDASHLDLSGGGNHAELFGASLVFSEVACFSSDSVYIEFIPPGCTNPEACNYDDLAVMNDGSCLYLPSMTLPDSVATCEDVVTLEAPAGYDSYSWSTSETTPSVQITESGTYVVEGHVFGPWGWVTGEEVSVTFWNTLQETPNEGCAEMYSSDGFHIADCSEAKLFVLEFDSMEELGGGGDLSIDGFTYVNPDNMLECNSGLDVGLSSVYFLSTEALSFGEAESICEGLGGHLVSINSEEENNFVANIDGCFLGCGNDCPGFWIGLEREVCSSAFSTEVTFSTEGCTDPQACNFNSEAACDDGNCVYAPTIDLGEDIVSCEEWVVLEAQDGQFFHWSTGESDSIIEVSQTGFYAVEASSQIGEPNVISGHTFIGRLGQSDYYISEASISWEDARMQSESLGGHLAVITSPEENELVWQGVYGNGLNPGGTNNYQAWIGLYQDFESPDYAEPNGGWRWVTDEAVSYLNWAANRPGNLDQGYFVHMTDANGNCPEGDIVCGTWDDSGISANLQSAFYVLEVESPYGSCTSSDSIFVEFDHGSCFCGPGTIWDAEIQMCIGDGSGDINLDGCVQLNDLLDLLSAYGDCGAEESPWQCGDPLEYQGYDYETVQIGEQCWFAENLRAENYRNGDELLSELSEAEWSSTSNGAVATYGEGQTDCESFNPDGDGCDDVWSLEQFGRLYNLVSLQDSRELCPLGWHSSTDEDWMLLETELGMNPNESAAFEYRGTDQGVLLKSTEGWFNGGAGSDLSGFSGLPGGRRQNSGFHESGLAGFWWSANADGSQNIVRVLDEAYDQVGRYIAPSGDAYSIRCIKSAE